MGGRTAYPWVFRSKITDEDRFLHKFIFCVPSFGAFR
jgi:hypothetical protein